MKTLILSTAAALALTAAPALASDQLARSLGVEPGAYSTAQLVELQRAYEEDDQTRIDFIRSGGSNLSAAESERRNLAQAIDRAVEEGDYTRAADLRERLSMPADSVVSTRGERNLPANLRRVVDRLDLNAGAFTTGELLTLERALEEGDMPRVRGLVSRVQG